MDQCDRWGRSEYLSASSWGDIIYRIKHQKDECVGALPDGNLPICNNGYCFFDERTGDGSGEGEGAC